MPGHLSFLKNNAQHKKKNIAKVETNQKWRSQMSIWWIGRSQISHQIPLRSQGVEEGVYGVGAAGAGHRAGVLTHVRKLDLLDDKVAVFCHREADIVAVGRLAVSGGPDHPVVTDILALL